MSIKQSFRPIMEFGRSRNAWEKRHTLNSKSKFRRNMQQMKSDARQIDEIPMVIRAKVLPSTEYCIVSMEIEDGDRQLYQCPIYDVLNVKRY